MEISCYLPHAACSCLNLSSHPPCLASEDTATIAKASQKDRQIQQMQRSKNKQRATNDSFSLRDTDIQQSGSCRTKFLAASSSQEIKKNKKGHAPECHLRAVEGYDEVCLDIHHCIINGVLERKHTGNDLLNYLVIDFFLTFTLSAQCKE